MKELYFKERLEAAAGGRDCYCVPHVDLKVDPKDWEEIKSILAYTKWGCYDACCNKKNGVMKAYMWNGGTFIC